MQDFQDMLRETLYSDINEGRKRGYSDQQKSNLIAMRQHGEQVLKAGIDTAFDQWIDALDKDEALKKALDRDMKAKCAEIRYAKSIASLRELFLRKIDEAYEEFKNKVESNPVTEDSSWYF